MRRQTDEKDAYLVDAPGPPAEPEFSEAELRFLRWIEQQQQKPPAGHERIRRLSKAHAVAFLRLVRAGANWQMSATALGIRRNALWRWLRRGRQETKGPYHRFARAVEAAESAAVADAECAVFNNNPLAWLARRARSHPGYLGWEPDALKLDVGLSTGAAGPIKVEVTESAEQASARLRTAFEVLHSLDLFNERMLVGTLPSDDADDTAVE